MLKNQPEQVHGPREFNSNYSFLEKIKLIRMKRKISKQFISLLIPLTLISCFNKNPDQSVNNETANNDQVVLKVAGYDLDRLKGIYTGRVAIGDFKVEFHKIGIGDANTAAFSRAGTYDITEIGLHPFMLAYANDDFRDYTLIPVFPIRTFRHKSIFIRNDGAIKTPRDLVG